MRISYSDTFLPRASIRIPYSHSRGTNSDQPTTRLTLNTTSTDPNSTESAGAQTARLSETIGEKIRKRNQNGNIQPAPDPRRVPGRFGRSPRQCHQRHVPLTASPSSHPTLISFFPLPLPNPSHMALTLPIPRRAPGLTPQLSPHFSSLPIPSPTARLSPPHSSLPSPTTSSRSPN